MSDHGLTKRESLSFEAKVELAKRRCGSCHACCVWLGIDAKMGQSTVALRKFPGQTCKKLDAGLGSETKCSVYSSRPVACQTYLCGWRNGFLDAEGGRPDESGILISHYKSEVEGIDLSATITITDPTKCGSLTGGPLLQAIDEHTKLGFLDIRIVNFESRAVIHLFLGKIYHGELTTNAGPEELSFVTFNPPIGTWELKEKKDETTID